MKICQHENAFKHVSQLQQTTNFVISFLIFKENNGYTLPVNHLYNIHNVKFSIYRRTTSSRGINSFRDILLKYIWKLFIEEFSFITDPKVKFMNIHDQIMQTACLVP